MTIPRRSQHRTFGHNGIAATALLDRRSVLRGLLVAGGTAALTSGMAACGGDDGGAEPGTGAEPDANGEPPEGGGKITVGVTGDLADFDPFNHLLTNFPIMNTMYSYLIDYDDDFQPHPDLAEEWEIAEDGSSVEIKLREARFHDGSPVTAADVIAEIGRAHV